MGANEGIMEELKSNKLALFFQSQGALLAFAPALAALLGSLYYSEIAGFEPCKLCWFQRILMYPIPVLLLVGIFSDDWVLPRYILPLSITGLGVSGYHYMLQNGWIGGEQFCSAGVSCITRYVNLMGFMTIPMMAFIAFLLITGLMFVTDWAYRQDFPAAADA
jgi:disulfide bond formation protein DsbB